MKRKIDIVKKYVQLILGLALGTSIVLTSIAVVKVLEIENDFSGYIIAIGAITGCYLAIAWGSSGIVWGKGKGKWETHTTKSKEGKGD